MNGINAGVSFAGMMNLKGFLLGGFLLALASCTPENRGNISTGTNSGESPAIDFLADQIREYPDSIGLFQALVDTLANRGRFMEAAAWVSKAMKIDSINYKSWLLVKGDLFRLGKYYDSAITTYRQYLSYFPENEAIMLNLANTYAEAGNDSCLALCRHIATRYPSAETRAKSAFIAGLFFNVTGKYSEARTRLDSAIILNYNFTEAWMERGYSYYDEKKYAEAEKNFRQLTEINKGNADAWYWMAKCAEASGNKDNAVAWYTRAFQLNPGLSEADEALSRLKKN